MRTAAVLLAYLAVAGLGLYDSFRPTVESRFALTPGDRCDSLLNHYVLEHTWQSVANPDYRGSLFSPPCFFPERHTLWYSEHLLGAAPPYWVLRLGLPADLAYQWWQLLFALANFASAALVLRWLKQPHAVAILGGYLWAFALVHIDQLRHQQLLPRLWMPLAAYHAWMIAVAPSTRHLNRMLACVFLQAVTCVNTGWFLATGLATFLPFAVYFRTGAWGEVRAWLVAERWRVVGVVAFWGLVLVASFVPYVVVNWGIKREYKDCLGLIPTPSSWFTGLPGSRWDQTLAPHRQWVFDDCRLFCGFAIYALMLAAAIHLIVMKRSERPVEFALVAAGLVTVAVWLFLTIATRNGGPSPWYYVRIVPGATAIRCVSRVYVTIYLFGGLAALVWLGTVTARLRPGVRHAVLVAVAAAVIFEQTGATPPSVPKDDFFPAVDRVAERLRGAEAAYVVTRYTGIDGIVWDYGEGEVFGIWVGLRANVPVVNGYSGRFPDGHPRGKPADDAMLRAWLAGKYRGKLTIIDPDRPDESRVIIIE
jgi:hypothetical protein